MFPYTALISTLFASSRRLSVFYALLASLFLGGCNTYYVNPESNSSSSLSASTEETDYAPVESAVSDEVATVDSFLDSENELRTSPSQAKLRSAQSETVAEVDIWERLRGNFSLEYSNPNDEQIAKYEKWYSARPKYFERISRRAYWYLPYMLHEVEKRGMPAEIAILPALESAYRPNAVSRANAVGLWQFIAPTGRRFGLRQDWWMDGRQDMVDSTRAALDFLGFLANEFDNDWELVLASYNAGEGNVRRAIRRNQRSNRPVTYPHLRLPRETREYVPRLFAIRNIIRNPEKFGISLHPIPNRMTVAVVDARTQTDLALAASYIPLTTHELMKLNQGYLRGVTPPDGPHNILVPAEYASTLSGELEKLTPRDRLQWVLHRIKKGEFLYGIASRYDTTVPILKRMNQLKSDTIYPNQTLKIPIPKRGDFVYARASVNDVEIKDGKRTYTVRKGDSLSRISQLFETTIQTLLRLNNLTAKSIIYPGQKLIIWQEE
ncbi:MAG: LysM peptidoglycan-binding domain-containing protein [Gammaproteobacteria bacterium]|nr:LysM peptidoglycan-binding domain-containing protein [Gammaproteobacteria bacterium]MYD76878.1 LysM peptidoglycan-binding domain-containing protein [Gammaproteobacteria bacterium]MYJ51997.1 LysM peptidoglycan-binding domain-containing protein [Gammaproteobacteria bacterium]